MRKRYQRNRKNKRIAAAIQGAAICLTFVFLFFICSKRIDASTLLLRMSLPGFSLLSGEDKAMYKFADGLNELPEAQTVNKYEEDSSLIYIKDLVGVDDVVLQPETEPDAAHVEKEEAASYEDIEKLRDLEYLREHFYTVDKRTGLTGGYFNADDMLNTDLRLSAGAGPKVLIFHTHSNEMYADSDPGNLMDGIAGVGEKLADILNNYYNIETIHHTGRYDIVNGESMREGAYERMEPEIEQILQNYPSIEVAIDLHRDGVNDDVRLVTNINGAPTAKVMFFNGLCLLKKKGNLVQCLENPYIQTNLAFSFNAQLTANSMYPSFTRKIYLNAFRYSLHMLPKSMLIEVGAQTNTKEEAINAMGPLAAILSKVLMK